MSMNTPKSMSALGGMAAREYNGIQASANPARLTQVQAQLGDLEKALSMLEKAWNEHRVRIECCLRQEPMCSDGNQVEPPHSVPLADRIRRAASCVALMAGNIQATTEQVEL